MVAERLHIDSDNLQHPLTELTFDRSGTQLIVSSENGTIKMYVQSRM